MLSIIHVHRMYSADHVLMHAQIYLHITFYRKRIYVIMIFILVFTY